jgi:hypothetical protein
VRAAAANVAAISLAGRKINLRIPQIGCPQEAQQLQRDSCANLAYQVGESA